jgi:hypothetical protein
LSSIALNLERRSWLAWLLIAAALAIPHSYAPVSLLSSAISRTGAFTMAEKPKPEYRSKVGPIPPDNWDNDLPYNPDTDTSPGSIADFANKLIKGDKKNDKDKK